MNKNLNTLLALSFVLLQTHVCQAQKFMPCVKFDVAPCFTDPGAAADFKFVLDYQFSPSFRAGLGLGDGGVGLAESDYVNAEKEMVNAYQVFADVKWLATPQRKVSFLLSGECGYIWSSKWDSSTLPDGWDGDVIDDLGPTVTVAPGIDIALKRGSLQLTAELRWQQSSVRNHYHDLVRQRSQTLVGFGIAYQWGRRRTVK